MVSLAPHKPLVIGIDVDGVIADFVGPVLRYLSKHLGKQLTEQDITRFDMRAILGDSGWKAVSEQLLSKPGHASSLACYPEAPNAINKLREMGRVVFVTTPYAESPTWSHDRTRWLVEHTGAKLNDVVHCWDKSLFGGDVLVDDAPHHLEAWTRSGRLAVRMARPWNEGASGQCASDLNDVVRIVREYQESRKAQRTGAIA
jgi:5'(3')-deoxyribonucleotidase